MKYLFYWTLVAAACLFAACNSDEGMKPGENENEEIEVPEKNYGTEEDIFHADYVSRHAIALSESQQRISESANAFAWNFFSKAFDQKKKGESLLLSPLSLTQNMMMLCNGLKGETLAEIMSGLGLSGYEMERIGAYVQQLNKGLDEADSRTKFRTNNAVWHRYSLALNPGFVQHTTPYYSLDIFPSAMDDQTLDAINEWASKNTFGRIEKMVPDIEGSDAVMMNTVYFRGLWEDELTERNIHEDLFTNEGGQHEKALMVKYFQVSPYSEGETFQATTRNFGNGAFVMDFVLPKEGVTAAEALHEYTDAQGRAAGVRTVELKFPVFETTWGANLNDLLQRMGMGSLLDPKSPEDICFFTTPVMVNDVVQKASISVSEKGTEAAAGTYEKMVISPGEEEPQTVEMVLNRPFFYVIRETSTDTPLFIGYLGSVR